MKACLRWQLRVLRFAWWLVLLLPVLALLLGWEAAAALKPYLLRGGGTMDPRSALALVLDVRHLFPLAGAVWAALFIGMDYAADARSVALRRGYSRRQVNRCKLLLFLLGCCAVSLMEQAFLLLTAVPGLSALQGSFLLRCVILRLALDVGMMIPPAVVCFLAGNDLYVRLLGLVYGFVLWRLMGSHPSLWLEYARWGQEERLALWPLAALGISAGCVWVLSRRG